MILELHRYVEVDLISYILMRERERDYSNFEFNFLSNTWKLYYKNIQISKLCLYDIFTGRISTSHLNGATTYVHTRMFEIGTQLSAKSRYYSTHKKYSRIKKILRLKTALYV